MIDVFASKAVFLASRLGELNESAEIQAQEEPPLKKRKMETQIVGLVGYGGDSESDSDPGAGGVIGLLGGYESAEDQDQES